MIESCDVHAVVIVVTCRAHGLLWSDEAGCDHEVQDIIRRVGDGHSKPYGADCQSVLDVRLLNHKTMEPLDSGIRQWHPAPLSSDEKSPPRSRLADQG